jgi:hypothetical protein
MARNKSKRFTSCRASRIGLWNITGINRKETDLKKGLNMLNVDIAAITKTKYISKRFKKPKDSIPFYSRIDQNKHATLEVTVLVKMRWCNKIHRCNCNNKRILTLQC